MKKDGRRAKVQVTSVKAWEFRSVSDTDAGLPRHRPPRTQPQKQNVAHGTIQCEIYVRHSIKDLCFGSAW